MVKFTPPGAIQAYLVGGGIASFAAAVFLIRDGKVPGPNIHIFEESEVLGGSLDAAGQAEKGYVLRGGRMLNFSYFCTYDVLSSIPSLEHKGKSAYDDITEFDRQIRSSAQARLVNSGGYILDATSLGFTEPDRVELVELMGMPEEQLGTKRINEWFKPGFFRTNFWYMWSTMFSFQPWHSLVEFKRYLLRFLHEFPRLGTLAGADRTPYNQYDSVVLPMMTWLRGQGVDFRMGCQVTDIEFNPLVDTKTAIAIRYTRHNLPETQTVQPHDLVLMTNGSMAANSTLGSMTTAPRLNPAKVDGSWALWRKLARKYPDFGRPHVFDGRSEESTWESFTVTSKGTLFFDLMAQFSGNRAGTGALVSLVDSSWMLSVALPYQPHFLNQPADVTVFWGFGLYPDRVGNYVKKKMSECTGEEILTELVSHLQFSAQLPAIVEAANCIPCMLPYITSPFLTRAPGDRPQVVPEGSTNFAFMGQFTEIPDDAVFTVEYSVRSAQMAVYQLLKLDLSPPAVYKGQHEIKVVYNAMKAINR
ncbi:oleate hydratase [Hymenobacter sp. BT770]|uniref:oleate hydratase n=1 Tax=Hymenobacter sp. BT770 TaxID=2886942 RepID=UPI001D123014|nr:oleate hydratase [Hymenobacter sp. BT770]MCC3155337.1 oleate hydratase [Hymenobacter sp. BT770]MDO3417370.1 oleate hydratase [Hymenobacter sp. BT770]